MSNPYQPSKLKKPKDAKLIEDLIKALNKGDYSAAPLKNSIKHKGIKI